MSICGHIRGPFAAAVASQPEKEREREPQIAIASNTIAESSTPSLPTSLVHSLDLQTSRDSVFTQSVIFGGRERIRGRKEEEMSLFLSVADERKNGLER